MTNDSCPGHRPNIWDVGLDDGSGEVTYCGGSCITEEVSDADEEADMLG